MHDNVKTKHLRHLTPYDSSCNKPTDANTIYDLNLPSFALYINCLSFTRIFHRTITNVGSATSTYKAKVTSIFVRYSSGTGYTVFHIYRAEEVILGNN